MSKNKPQVVNYETLNEFLLTMLDDVKKGKVTAEDALALTRIADKIIKNNMTMLMYSKLMNKKSGMDFFEPKLIELK